MRTPIAFSILSVGLLMATTVHALPMAAYPKTVADRMDKEHEPTGHKVYDFLIIPRVDVGASYADNIYATENSRKEDALVFVEPSFTADSKWDRHSLGFYGNVHGERYNHHTSDDAQTFELGTEGRYDITRNTNVRGFASVERLSEDRGDPANIDNGVKPVKYTVSTGGGSFNHREGNIEGRISTKVRNLNFSNGFTSDGFLVDNNLRDRTELIHTGQLFYTVAPKQTAYVRVTADHRQYDQDASHGRNNRGLDAVAGFNANWTRCLYTDVYAGYIHRDYSLGFDDIGAMNYGGSIAYDLNATTTLVANGYRSIEETTINNSSGFLQTVAYAGAQHKFTPKVLGELYGVFRNADYNSSGPGSQRSDDYWSLDARATYYMTNNLSLKGQYLYNFRQSNIAGSDYSRNTVMLTASMAF